MNKIFSVALGIIFSFSAFAQTGIGTLTHIANAVGHDESVDSPLKGEWIYEKLIGDKKDAVKSAASALAVSGFHKGTTQIIFAEGAAFAILSGDKVIPGTWKDMGDGNVRISFSKIFTYGMTGKMLERGQSYDIVFPAEDFYGFVQRVLAIIGRKDTTELMTEMQNSSPLQLGFKIHKQ